jgi:hypothetical protein
MKGRIMNKDRLINNLANLLFIMKNQLQFISICIKIVI